MGRRLLLFALLCFDRRIPHSVLLIAIGENVIKMVFIFSRNLLSNIATTHRETPRCLQA